MRRWFVIYVLISLPMVLGAGVLLYLTETDHSGPWTSLEWAIYFIVVAALWLGFSALYWGVIAFRAGYHKTIYGVTGAIALALAIWGAMDLWQRSQCAEVANFYLELKRLPFDNRRAYINAGAEIITGNHHCGRDALSAFFVRDFGIDREITAKEEQQRLATWDLLLAWGLAPQDYFPRAIYGADAPLFERLLMHLKTPVEVHTLGGSRIQTKPEFLTIQAFHAISRHGLHYKQREKNLALRIIDMLLAAGAVREQKDKWGKTLASRLKKLRK